MPLRTLAIIGSICRLNSMKVGLIGCGRMGGALVQGAVEGSVIKPTDLWLSSRTQASAQQLASATGGQIADSHSHLINQCDVVLLGCKPYQIIDLLQEISPSLPADVVIVSVAAGITLHSMEKACPDGTRIIRAMPNTPSMIGQGATGIASGSHATEQDLERTSALMESVGISVTVSESQIDAVTGVSGSGPAYLYTMIKAMAEQGESEGLNSVDSLKLATQTALGAAKMITQTGRSPQDLIDQVTSPGGTTVAGLEVLRIREFETIVADCVHTAAERSREIARGD